MRYVPLSAVAQLAGSRQSLASGDDGLLTVCRIASWLAQCRSRAIIPKLSRIGPVFGAFSRACISSDDPRERAPKYFIGLSRVRGSRQRMADREHQLPHRDSQGYLRAARPLDRSIADRCRDKLQNSVVMSRSSLQRFGVTSRSRTR